jgi:LysM repeat protein
MNREDPYRDQAEKLRKRIEKINDASNDDSSMPPRSDLHRLKKKKTKWKLKYPVIRLLVLFFILLPITIFSIYSYIEGKKYSGTEKATVSSQGYETIDFENPDKQKVKQDEVNPQNSEEINGTEQENENNKNTTTSENPESDTQSNGVIEQKNVKTQSSSTDSMINGHDTDKNGSGQVDTITKNPESFKIIYHTVQPQETLFRIAMNYYHASAGIDIIKQANHIQNNDIETGQVLKIPLKK